MSTKRKQAQGRAGQGVRFVESVVGDHNCTFIRVPQEDDVGIDGYIEFVQAEEATGCCIAVQIKSGTSYRSGAHRTYSFSSDVGHFEYWSMHSLPVAVIFFDPEENRGFWGDITTHLKQHPERIQQGPYTISATREFSSETLEDFRNYWLTYRNEYAQNAGFGQALEDFSQLTDLDRCTGGLLALFSFHRSRPASWHYLINSIRHFRGHPLLGRLLDTLAHLPGHGDIFWHPGNYVLESTRKAVLPLFREHLGRDDFLVLLEAVDDLGFQRGAIGWDVDAIIHQSARREELLESIAFDACLDERTRVFALNRLSYYVERRSLEECAALFGRFLSENPGTEWEQDLRAHQEMLLRGEHVF